MPHERPGVVLLTAKQSPEVDRRERRLAPLEMAGHKSLRCKFSVARYSCKGTAHRQLRLAKLGPAAQGPTATRPNSWYWINRPTDPVARAITAFTLPLLSRVLLIMLVINPVVPFTVVPTGATGNTADDVRRRQRAGSHQPTAPVASPTKWRGSDNAPTHRAWRRRGADGRRSRLPPANGEPPTIRSTRRQFRRRSDGGSSCA